MNSILIPLVFVLSRADAGARMYFPGDSDEIFFGPSDDLVSGPSQTILRGNVERAREIDENSLVSGSPDISQSSSPPDISQSSSPPAISSSSSPPDISQSSSPPDISQSSSPPDISSSSSPLDISQSSSPCPEGLDWCDEPEHYPGRKIISVAARQANNMKILFPEKLATRAGFVEVDNKTELETDSYENICGMETDYIMPRAAKNKEGQFRFIVNSPEGADEYIQLVRVVRCLHAGHQCGGGRLFSSQTTMCKQEFLDHKLVALSESGEELVIDTFLFPSCCTCNFHAGLEFK